MSEHKIVKGIYCKEYDLPFEYILEKVKSTLTENGFKIFCIIDHKQAAEDYGMEMFPATVIIFGNPKGGTNIIKNSPLIAIDLPSKILIKADKRTEVCFNTMASVKERHELKNMDEVAMSFDSKVIGIISDL